MAKKTKETKEVAEVKEVTFPKESILGFDHFTAVEKDFLNTYLEDREYSIDEAQKILSKKLKGVVE